MRRRVLVTAVLLAVPVLAAPAVSAAPVPPAASELCAVDVTRGAVPAAFPLEACVDGAGVTLRNDRDRPVVVSGQGEFGAPVLVRAQNDVVSDVVRRTSPGALVLLPGEVARWPIGSGAVEMAVAPLPVAAAPEIAQTLELPLGRDLPAEATQALLDSAGALVRDVGSAVRTRAACAEGRSFLGTAACDVTAAAAIGSATAARLERRTAAEVLPELLDPAAWADWPLADPEWPADAETALRQQAAAAPAPALSTPSGPPVSVGTGAPADTGRSREPVVRPSPTPASTSPLTRTRAAPSPPPTPEPAPTRRPVPAPPPVHVPPPVQAPAPPPVPQVQPPSWQEIHERNMARLRELAAAWEKAVEQARQQERERERDDERGGGPDRGRGDR